MTYRELLELAAKAAGIDIEMTLAGMPWLASGKRPWNPLTDDGDALRLAVTLRMSVLIGDGGQVQACVAEDIGDGSADEYIVTDPLAATRRAITRAAAEIGRSMK